MAELRHQIHGILHYFVKCSMSWKFGLTSMVVSSS